MFFGPNYRFYINVNVNKISTVVLAPALNRILTTPSTTTYRETEILGSEYSISKLKFLRQKLQTYPTLL